MNLLEMKLQEGFVTVISSQTQVVNIFETQVNQLVTSHPLSQMKTRVSGNHHDNLNTSIVLTTALSAIYLPQA
jgi:hypothetical protein